MNTPIYRELHRLEVRRADNDKALLVYEVGGMVGFRSDPSRPPCRITRIFQQPNRTHWIDAYCEEDQLTYQLQATDWIPESNMPAKKKTDIDPEEVAVWDDDVDDVLEAIGRGYLDKHLRRLAAAAIERHREVSGKTPLKTVEAPSNAYVAPTATASEQLAVASVPTATKTWADAHKMEARHVTDSNGKIHHFEKRLFIGKTIKINPGILEDTQYDGLRVKVSGMGGKMVKVDFVDAPPPGSGYDKKVKNNQPCFMTYKVVLPYLDIN